MRFAMNFGVITFSVAIVVATFACSSARAEGAFIQQATGSYQGRQTAFHVLPHVNSSPSTPSWTAPHPGNTQGALQSLAVPAGGQNIASTLEIGAYNKVFQAQAGTGNISNVGIIGGKANNVGVLQAGNNLRSNVALINTQGLPVAVIQPPGSAPINVLIARLPNGALLIKR
jgi:hypothetical protein